MTIKYILAPEVHFSEIEHANLAQVWPGKAVASSKLTMLIVAPAIEVAMLIDNVEELRSN